MNWECSVDNALDEVDEIPEEILQKYPTGTGWETEDGGRTASHTSGAVNKRFHASSLYGKIIDEITGAVKGYGNAQLAAGGDVVTNLDGLMDVLRERGNPTQADVWKGLRFRFAEVVFDYGTNKKTGEKMTSRRSMPVEFLGVAGEEKAAAKTNGKAASKPAASEDKVAAEKAKAAEKAAAKKAAEAPTEDGIAVARQALDAFDDLANETKDAVLAVLAEADDHATFVDACLEIDGVPTHDGLMELVVDDEGGLWVTRG